MIFFARIGEVAARAIARTEARHWFGIGASAVLHLAVLLGWHNAPPPEPQPISFEVTFEPPEAAPQRAVKQKALKKVARKSAKQRNPKTRIAKNKASPDIVPRERHLLDSDWRAEKKAAKDVPALALPDARALGIQGAIQGAAQDAAQAHGMQPLQRSTASATASAVAERVQAGDSGAELSEPDATSAGGSQGKAGDTGVALTNSTSLADSQGIKSDVGSGGAQANNTPAALAGAASGGESPTGMAGFANSSTPQAALSAASGAGMQAAKTPTATVRIAPGGAEASGVRLMASGVLSAAARLPAGDGAVSAAPQAATPAQGAARIVAAMPLSSSASGGGLAGSPQARPDSRNPGVAYSGSAATGTTDVATSRGGRGQEGVGRLAASTAAASAVSGGTRFADAPGRSGQRATSLALAPGEPGSSPSLAVALQPILAGAQNGNASRGGASATGASGEVAVGTDRAQPGMRRYGGARSMAEPIFAASGEPASVSVGQAPGFNAKPAVADGGAAPRQGASAAIMNAARESGRPPVVLQAAQPLAVKVVRPDTEIQRLDVLAPSNYCPLPLPGHQQPDNRAPQPARQIAEQPTYAPDNPSIQYPVMANINGVEGRVTVRVEVLADGRPGKMWLKQSSGSGILDRDAQAQLKKWRFMPARMNGQPVSAWIDVPVLYRLPRNVH